ncbi:hypothetical protein GCM10023096_73340 [Nonomuraea ferruginea]
MAAPATAVDRSLDRDMGKSPFEGTKRDKIKYNLLEKHEITMGVPPGKWAWML